MNQQNPIDELFRRHLEQASAPVSDDMWERIQNARQPDERKRRPFWWRTSLGLGVLLPFLVLGAYWWSDVNLPTSVELETFPVQQNINSTPLQSTTPANTPIAAAVAPSTTTVVSTPDATPSIPSARNSESANRDQLVATDSQLALSTTPAIKRTTALSETITTPTPTEEGSIAVATDASGQKPEIQEEEGRISGPHQRAKVHAVAILPTNDFEWRDNVDWDQFVSHAPKCAKFAADFLHFDLDVMAGPAYAHQMLQLRTSEGRSHLEDRQRSESTSLSYNAGIRLSAISNTGLGLRLGLNYNQINETFSHKVGSRMDVSTLYGANGEIIGMDTTLIEAYMQESSNKLRFLEVPVLLGYETQCGHLRVGVNAGAMLNLYFDAEGSIYSPTGDNQPMDFGQTGDLDVLPLFKSQATAAWYVGASLAYNVKNRYSIVAEPYFRSFPRALSNVDYSLQQNYWQMGLQMGVRMRL